MDRQSRANGSDRLARKEEAAPPEGTEGAVPTLEIDAVDELVAAHLAA